MDFDKILQKVGGWNRYQIYMYVIIGLAGLHPGMHNLAGVFTAGYPDYTCHVTGSPDHVTLPELKSISSPPSIYDSTKYNPCSIYDLNYTQLTNGWTYWTNKTFNNTGVPTSNCQKWDYDNRTFEYTIVTRWNLVCKDAWKRATSQSIYMFGFMVGCFAFGSLSDRIGRKPTFLMSIALLVVSGTAAALAPEYWSYVLLRCVSGTAAAGSFTGGFVIVMEIIEEQHRLLPSLCYQGFFAAGYMLLAVIAHYVRNYQHLQLIISIPPVIFLIFYWFMDESPRWLISQGRYEEAEKIIRKMAKMNKQIVPEEMLKVAEKQLPKNENHEKYSFIDMMRTPNMRKRAFNTFFNWFVNSMVFYGLSFGVADLGGSPHLNLAISGSMEFPSYFLIMLLMNRIGRRWSLMSVMVLGGIICACTLAIPKHMIIPAITLSMLGKLAISGSFSAIYVFSGELFPTVLRNTAVGSGSMHARIGGTIAPLVAELRHLVWEPLPIIIFSVSSIMAGVLALLLPETLHQHLPETIEDGELFGTKKYREYINDKKASAAELQEMNNGAVA